jgi:hypothetical protein
MGATPLLALHTDTPPDIPDDDIVYDCMEPGGERVYLRYEPACAREKSTECCTGSGHVMSCHVMDTLAYGISCGDGCWRAGSYFWSGFYLVCFWVICVLAFHISFIFVRSPFTVMS